MRLSLQDDEFNFLLLSIASRALGNKEFKTILPEYIFVSFFFFFW